MPTAILTILTFASALNLGHIDLSTTSSFSSLALSPGTAGEAQIAASSNADFQPFTLKTYEVRITAYSSNEDETDDTPFITASGARVRDGIVATNFLPFGTKLMIPSLFGGKIFTVEDRMNKRIPGGLDIWMPSKSKALRFGAAKAEIMIVQYPEKEQITKGLAFN